MVGVGLQVAAGVGVTVGVFAAGVSVGVFAGVGVSAGVFVGVTVAGQLPRVKVN
jgi:hypothetical protein